jgi:hypothetical protein
MFGSAFCVAAVFATTLPLFSSRKISNEFLTKIYVKREAPKNSRLQNCGELRGASAPAVQLGRPIAKEFDKNKVVHTPLSSEKLSFF